LKTATKIVIQKIRIPGIAATSVEIHLRLSKTEKAIQPQIIITANCFSQSPKSIGSSFSICTGILYCINFYFYIYLHNNRKNFFFKINIEKK
jgi:hypothetical protein